MTRASSWWVGVAVLLLPRLAEACPMCASQQHGGTARVAALGVMLLLPFAVVFVVFRALRSAGEHTTARVSASQRWLGRLCFGLSSFLQRRGPTHPPPGR
jgi:hypothetical protein